MPDTRLSVEEIKAVAETAITAKHAADAAKTALEADPENQTLKDALASAETEAASAKAKADALSQNQPPKKSVGQIAKMKRKRAIITRELQDAGELGEDDDEDDDEMDLDDPDRPVTFGDLQRIERQKASQTAMEMAMAITDSIAREAVKSALGRVQPSGNPQQDFTDAVAIANRDKNNKILEELARRPNPAQHHSGAGAGPAKAEPEFAPSDLEAQYMRPPFNLSKKEILEARAKQPQT